MASERRIVRLRNDLANRTASTLSVNPDLQKARTLQKIRNEAVAKELDLRNARGSSCLPEPHYPKSFFIKKKDPEAE